MFQRGTRGSILHRVIVGVFMAGALLLALPNQGDVNAATLNSRIVVNVTGDLQSALDLVTSSAPLQLKHTVDLADGVGAAQADMIWSDQRTIAASTTEDLDLAGALLDAFGAAFTPAKVKAVIVRAASGNTNNVVVGGDAAAVPIFADPTDTVAVQPGGIFVLVAPGLAGYAVTATTGDIIQVANSGAGTTVTYDIVIIGTSS